MNHGQDWVGIGFSRNDVRYSIQNASAGRLAAKIEATPEYAAFIEKCVEIVNEEQGGHFSTIASQITIKERHNLINSFVHPFRHAIGDTRMESRERETHCLCKAEKGS